MPVRSPFDDIQNLVLSISVAVDGKEIQDSYAVQTITVEHGINKISFAQVSLKGEVTPGSGAFALSDSDDFFPGNSIVIKAGYGNPEQFQLFKGLIVKHSISINTGNFYTLNLDCKHDAVQMTFNPKDWSYDDNVTDNSIISGIISDNGLTAAVSGDAGGQAKEGFSTNAITAWDLLLKLCNNNGYIICMDGDSVDVGKPQTDGTPVLRVEAGDSLLSFNCTLNAENQPGKYIVSVKDPKDGKQQIQYTAAEPGLKGLAAVLPSDLAGKLGQDEYNRTLGVEENNPGETQKVADGELLVKRLAAISGSVKFSGTGTVKTGNLIELKGVGKKFQGNAFVSTVTHSIGQDGWTTSVNIGFARSSPVQRMQRAADPFSPEQTTGKTQPVKGLQFAKVTKLSEDPLNRNRIEITLPSHAETQRGIWARLSNFYATGNAGSGFWPEVGDEVVVGFAENDAENPVVLGSLYSETLQSPNPQNDEKNNIKSITTRSKMVLSFDEENKIIEIKTPGNNKITISDKDKQVTIEDQNNNSVKLSTDGIIINSAKDIQMTASGDIKLTATGNISLEATQDVKVSGMNVVNEAQVGFTGKGSASAEVSASGTTTVKGSIVMIN